MELRRPSAREFRDMRVEETVAKAMAGLITWKETEHVLCCSARHVRRLRARCVIENLEALQKRFRDRRKLERELRGRLQDVLRDKRAGRVMPKRVEPDVVRDIMHLRQTRYFDFNVQHFHEKLQEKHGISVG